MNTSSSMAPAFCGLLPHAPIVVPGVGGVRRVECEQTERACAEFAQRMVARRPSRLLLVSPHAPRRADAFGIWAGTRLRGDLSDFGAADAAVDLPNDPALREHLEAECLAAGLLTWSISRPELDHGGVVPLRFLVDAGWHGPTCVVSLPATPHPLANRRFGDAIAAAMATLPGSPALIASGDMTHRATRTAPAGYHARALEFDATLRELVAGGQLAAIPKIDPELRDLAAEDAADAATIVSAAIGFRAHGAEVLSYEHPFGVGYLVAVFHDGDAT